MKYSTVQYKLDIYTYVALELFNEFGVPLASYMQAHDAI